MADTTPDERASWPKRFLRPASLFFYYAYVVTVVVAGAWGMVGARVDFPVLMSQPLAPLDKHGAINVLSQYRFLRGLELGFGIFAVRFRGRVYAERTFNAVFLTTMGLGILGRVFGLVIDGLPSALMLSFLIFEVVGIVLIFADTRVVNRTTIDSTMTRLDR